MPYAVILNTASVAATAGGTFADSLTANSGDSLQVGNYDTGGARIIQMWGCDSDSAAELEVYYTRPQSTADQTNGYRVSIPAISLGGAAKNGAFNLLGGGVIITVFKSDTAVMKASTTASDDVAVSWLTEYDDLPGVSANFASWDVVQNYHYATVNFYCNAQASTATAGLYGAARAVNADDTRWVADTYYAILGFSWETWVTTIALKGYDWGAQLIGAPAGALYGNNRMFFVDLSVQRNRPLIPILNSNNVGNTNMYVVDLETSTSPHVDIHCYQLTQKPPTVGGGAGYGGIPVAAA